MNRHLLIFFILMLPCKLFSQQFEGGFFVGFSASQIDGDNFYGYDKAGITAGAYTSRAISRNLYWKAEVRYMQKGSYKKITEESPEMYKTSLHYGEVPLVLQYFYNKQIFLEAGLIPEVLFFAKVENEYGVIPDDQIHSFYRFSLEGALGAGYFFTKNMAVAGRFNYSLLPARSHASGQIYRFNRGQYNNLLSIALYYHFR